MSKFTDNDAMPFGKHKGIKLANVPAKYLLWLHDNIASTAPNKRSIAEKYLIEYIIENKDVLLKESEQ